MYLHSIYFICLYSRGETKTKQDFQCFGGATALTSVYNVTNEDGSTK